MPSSTEILFGLTAIANRGVVVAVVWHVVIALVCAALARGWRPSRHTAAMLIVLPLTSVSAFAFAFANPFNGALFAAGAVALIALARTAARQPVSRGPSWTWGTGLGMLAFGWVYPHFLQAHPVAYLLASPVGLVPCPTLSVAIGLALMAGGLGSRAWQLTLAGLGLFYGAFGILRLGVWLDLGLVAGALVLGAAAIRTRRAAARHPREFKRRADAAVGGNG